MQHKIIFLRPRGITRFRIQESFFSDTTSKYIQADTIYSLYLSKLLETDDNFRELNNLLSDEKNDKEEILKEIKTKFLKNLPRISSAYPYYINNNQIYFYLPFIYKKTIKDKKLRKKYRDPHVFLNSRIVLSLLEGSIDNISIKEEEYIWAPIKTEKVTRNKINRITNTTDEEGSLFTEEYVFCYKNEKEELGYYFLVEDNKNVEDFINKIREFFEIRGIGADKSVSNSTFKMDYEEEIKKEVNNYEDYKKGLLEAVDKIREEKFTLHPIILNSDTENIFKKIKLKFILIDGLYLYPIASDGSELKEDLTDIIAVKIRRRFKGKLTIRVFYGL